MGSENRRILLATALSAAILFGFMAFQTKTGARRAPAGADAGAPAAASPAQPAPAAPAPAPAVAPVPAAPEETAVLETPELKATFSTLGGALKSLELKGEKFRRQQKDNPAPVDLVHVTAGQPWPLAMVASPELGGTGSLADDPAARASMRLVEKDARSVTFEGTVGAAQVRKRFFVGERAYELGLELSAQSDRKGDLALLYPAYVSPDAPKPGFFSGGQVAETLTPLCRAAGKTARFGGKEAREAVPGAVAWAGLDQHYFVSVLVPTPEMGECVFFRGPAAGASGTALRLPVDGQLHVKFALYTGPKQLDLLRVYGRDLETAVDYGAVTNLFAFFARILLYVMRTLERFVGNWGVAIILLTVLVKALLYPLTAKSMQSMNEMRRLQPEIEKLKAKHGEDKEKLNQAVMQLYQQHKVNPLGGCLPMLIQMPIWFALYATLQTSVELYREPFLWLKDLTQFDPFYVLPLAMGVSSFLMQRLSPQPADNAQAKMLLYFMPIFFTFIMLRLPSGLTLYILVNNVLSIAQQQWLMKRQQPAPAPAKA
ncbi:membrane protein insertase YidC [Anaeromyxobacter diazotrophicus]|uniref:Membrane protein insertase YidC n=1 Tax=Anaeromyxobacter diazotrophicus TaxID=2590199 RepID=A0A7I9VNK2_9BACT|nr:membrane protein insertase YidC [Anaeromyxobacter diazotrophicus]GEJ57690.1 membrane protein insertase YidC [Anaeromyxobacter diazotrophicus]